MAIESTKSYDESGRFIDVVRRDIETGKPIDRTRHVPYNNPWDFLSDDLGEVIETEVYEP